MVSKPQNVFSLTPNGSSETLTVEQVDCKMATGSLSSMPASSVESVASSSSSTQEGSLREDPTEQQFLPTQRLEARALALSRPTLPSFPSQTLSQKWRREEGFWRSFVAICIPLLLSALEGSVTNTALPTISDVLDLGTQFSWVATAFLLASMIFQPLYGQLGDMWGRKYPMMAAVAVFATGSAICGSADSGAVLIFGRVVQGLGTGGIDLFAEMILCDIVPLRKRGPYLAIKHAVFAVGTTLGPLLGGVFAEHGWRWCFLVNIPICVLAIAVMYFWLHVGGGFEMKDVSFKEGMKKVDLCGTAMLTTSVILLLVALSTGGASHPWGNAAVIVPFTFSIFGFAAFAVFQRSGYCAHPIMPKEVFSNRTTNVAFALTAIHGFITYGFQFFLPPFLQAVKGSSPMQSGIAVLPTTLVVVVFAAVGGPLLTLWGRYRPIHMIGFGCIAFGLLPWITVEKDWPFAAWLCLQLLPAAGCGIVVSSMLPAVQVKLPEKTTGQSSASWAFLRGTGSLFGVAIPGAIFNARFASLLSGISSASARKQLENGQAYQRATSAFIRKFEPGVQSELVHSFTESLHCVWIVYTVMAAIGLLLTPLEKEHKMRKEVNSAYGLKTPKGVGQTPASTVQGSPVGTPVEEKKVELMV